MSAAQGRITAGVGSNLIGQHAQDRNQDATVYVGNLDLQVAEEMVWELFTQAGPVVNVYLPKDRVTSTHQGYGFVEFRSEEDADYAIKILNMIKLCAKPIRVNKAASDKRQLEVGANLFIGNLDADVDEKLLYDTFSAFGVIVNTPKIMRDPETGNSRGFGFVSYDCFEASDAAIEAMNGQFLCGRQVSVTYAYKKDTKGERHGTPAERLLAAQMRAKQAQQSRPHTMFATGPKQEPQPGLATGNGNSMLGMGVGAGMSNGGPIAPPAPSSGANGFAGMGSPPGMPPPPTLGGPLQTQQHQQQQKMGGYPGGPPPPMGGQPPYMSGPPPPPQMPGMSGYHGGPSLGYGGPPPPAGYGGPPMFPQGMPPPPGYGYGRPPPPFPGPPPPGSYSQQGPPQQPPPHMQGYGGPQFPAGMPPPPGQQRMQMGGGPPFPPHQQQQQQQQHNHQGPPQNPPPMPGSSHRGGPPPSMPPPPNHFPGLMGMPPPPQLPGLPPMMRPPPPPASQLQAPPPPAGNVPPPPPPPSG